MSAGTGLIEKFRELILRNKPLAAAAPNPILGYVQTPPGETETVPRAGAVLPVAVRVAGRVTDPVAERSTGLSR
ncbi:hypothetical protein ACLXNF_12410 [Mycobacteroides chelonae]|uniref:hypothetical protein n=1 Tax=Mycobacteroides chelonae TaxID=1774 RepID=UPI0039EC8680